MLFKWLLAFGLLLGLAGCAVLGPASIEVSDAPRLEAKVSGISSKDLNFRCICDSSQTETNTDPAQPGR
jgi:hypothetical protein